MHSVCPIKNKIAAKAIDGRRVEMRENAVIPASVRDCEHYIYIWYHEVEEKRAVRVYSRAVFNTESSVIVLGLAH